MRKDFSVKEYLFVEKFYNILALFCAILAIAVIILGILDRNGADSATQDDPEVIQTTPESLQRPIFEPEFEYLANNGDIFEKGVVQKDERHEFISDVRITHYCPCERCCGDYSGGPTASGRMPKAGRTAAADPSFLAQGTVVTIRGRDYVIEDTGPRYGVIDIFVNDHDEALSLGTYRTNVEVKHG